MRVVKKLVKRAPARPGNQLRMLRRRAGNVLIGLGVVLLAVWGVARLHSIVGSRLDRQAFEKRRSSERPAPPGPASTSGPVSSGAASSGPSGPVSSAPSTPGFSHPAEGNVDISLWSEVRVKGWKESLETDRRTPLALLRVPRLKIDVPVLEGTDEVTLNRGAGWIEGTARPGEPGNVALSAHRDGFFRALKDVAIGDVLILETPKETERYVVSWTKIVTPEDVSVLDATEGSAVTLVTCFPFYYVGSAPERFIVRALRKEKTAR